MANYFIIKSEYNKGDYYIEDNTESLEASDYYDNYQDLVDDTISYSIKGRNVVDYISGNQMFSVVSDKLKCLIESLKITNIQFVKANLNIRDDNNFWVFNLKEHIACVDFANSDCEGDEEYPELYKVDKLVLMNERISEKEIFRLSEMNSLIIISDGVKKIFEQNQVTGIKYLPVEEFKFPSLP